VNYKIKMRKIFTFLFTVISFSFFSQEDILAKAADTPSLIPQDTTWRTPGIIGLNISQTSLSDWQGGGQDNLSLISLAQFDPVYKKGIYEWMGKVDAQYGLIKTGDSKLYKKNIDRLFLLTKYDIKSHNKYWFYSVQADFRTQFSPGYDYYGDSVSIATSDFLCPAYIQLALGMDFKLEDYFTITFAPAAGKVTIVNRQYLADEGAYGVEPAVRDTAGNVITKGKRSRFEFGGRIVVRFKKEIVKNISLDSYVDLFSNYANNPGNIDVVINNTFNFKITRFFSASIISQMLYDDDIITKRDWDGDGLYDNPSDIFGPRLQALTTLAVGFAYKF